jgi:hypothetical protein
MVFYYGKAIVSNLAPITRFSKLKKLVSLIGGYDEKIHLDRECILLRPGTSTVVNPY